MSSKAQTPKIDYGDANVIRDEDRTNPIAVRFDHVRKTYKLFKNDKQRLAAVARPSRFSVTTAPASPPPSR